MEVHIFERIIERTDEMEPLTAHQIKDTFFNAMPNKWQTGFVLGGKSVNQFSLADLIKYMATRATDSGHGGRFGRGRQDSRGGHGGSGGTHKPHPKRQQEGGYNKSL
jgi:hypothetical protein